MLIFLLACAGSGDTADTKPVDTEDTQVTDLDPATVPLAGTCPQETDFGGITLLADDDATSIDGAVADGVVPTAVLEELAASGDCRVMRRNNPFCDPGCDPGFTCNLDGECVAYPVNQDLGTVTLDGLSVDVTLEAVFPGNTYFDTTLPNPAYDPGALLTFDMPGGTYGPLTLYGVGIEPFDMTGTTWTLEQGKALTLTWPAPTTAVVRSEIAVNMSIDQHGITPSTLMCVFEDDGEGTVDAAVVDALVSVGVTGFPAGSITRRTVDSGPAGAGCMEFTVSAPRVVNVDVVGFTPCVSDEDCPDDQTCNLELQICE